MTKNEIKDELMILEYKYKGKAEECMRNSKDDDQSFYYALGMNTAYLKAMEDVQSLKNKI